MVSVLLYWRRMSVSLALSTTWLSIPLTRQLELLFESALANLSRRYKNLTLLVS